MPALLRKVFREAKKVLPPSLFFFCTFHLIAFTQGLAAGQYGVTAGTFLKVTVAALLVGKVVLIADHLPFMNQFPHRPLLWNVFWKTAVYLLATFLVRYAERWGHFAVEKGSLSEGHSALIAQVVWTRFWSTQIWLAVLFFNYVLVRELLRELGRERILQLIFLPPSRRS